MTYELAIGDRTYSSWSLRGWLLFEKFDVDMRLQTARMYSDAFQAMLAKFPPARLVPVMKTPEGEVVQDTLAMAETLAERHPDKGFWPKEANARSFARSLSAEMHAGFSYLRTDCPMNLRRIYDGFQPSDAVLADVSRLGQLWAMAKDRFGAGGPWLFGDYSIADVFFAPAATRLATYQLPMDEFSKTYVQTHLSDLSFRRWRAMGLAENYIQPGYDKDLPEIDWTGPKALKAAAIPSGPSENATCPYSGQPVSHFMQVDQRIFGFCNGFCRDKTVADPMAWPGFVKIYEN